MEPSSLSPGTRETILGLIDQYMTNAHFCAPATVVSYNPATQSATVQPSLKQSYTDAKGKVQTALLPEINNVPVVFPATATAWIRLPVAAGDQVMLHFSDRSLDLWWTQGGQVDPGMPHKFELTDAIAVPGLRTMGAAIQSKGAPTSLEIANGPTWFEILITGQVRITNGTVDLIQALTTFATGLNVATLSGQAAALVTSLASLLAP